MSLTFYCAPMSTASLTELVLEELGVPCEKVMLDTRKGETKTPAFLAINPNGCVPCIVHDGTPLWESAALTMYLGETFGVERGLYPPPGPRRGEAMQWIVWTNVTLGDAVGRFARNTMAWMPVEQRNALAGEVGKRDILECFGILDRALEGKQFLLGDFTLADAHLNTYCDWLRQMKFDFTPFANLVAWGARCHARPACQRLRTPAAG